MRLSPTKLQLNMFLTGATFCSLILRTSGKTRKIKGGHACQNCPRNPWEYQMGTPEPSDQPLNWFFQGNISEGEGPTSTSGVKSVLEATMHFKIRRKPSFKHPSGRLCKCTSCEQDSAQVPKGPNKKKIETSWGFSLARTAGLVQSLRQDV